MIPLDIATVQTGDGGEGGGSATCPCWPTGDWWADVDSELEKFRKNWRNKIGMVCEWLRFGKGSLGNQANFALFTVC